MMFIDQKLRTIAALAVTFCLGACGQQAEITPPVDNSAAAVSPQALGPNLALNRPIVASSYEDGQVNGPYRAALANDGDLNTRWASQLKIDNQSIYVDLGAVKPIGNVGVVWEAAYASSYSIDLADDLGSWRNNVKTVNKNTYTKGAEDIATIPTGNSARYVRVRGLTRALAPYGYSIYEFRVYGADTTGGLPTSDTPDFGPNVTIFDPATPVATIQSKLDAAFQPQVDSPTAQFGTQRYAFLFKPGTYNAVFANLGFYTAVAGLGQNPDDVTINKGDITVDAGWNFGDKNNATQNFWRSAENIAVIPSSGTNRWAVSQAAPMRRVHIKGALTLQPVSNGWSSGGYIADSAIDGQVNNGGQQQWYTRDSSVGSWSNGVWNAVFSGVIGAPAQDFSKKFTTLDTTPVSREKPYLYIDATSKYRVFVPDLRINKAKGATWPNTQGTSIPMSQFYVAKPSDATTTLNAALAQGLNLFFTPGIYRLSQTLNVTRANTVVMGIGFPTLIPDGGVNAMNVADVDGVKISGLLFDAGTINSQALLTVGPTGSSANHAANPTSIQDVYFRIGGAVAGKASNSLIVNSNNTVIDHIWAWRADHGSSATGWTINTGDNGVVVNGNDVLATGLFAEHYQKYNVLWNGQNGKTIFFQNELPYDVPNQATWNSSSTAGYPAYKVADNVTNHEAWGVGSYCNFTTDPTVSMARAFEVPNVAGMKFHDLVTVSLNKCLIKNIINDQGAAVSGAKFDSYLNEAIFSGAPPPPPTGTGVKISSAKRAYASTSQDAKTLPAVAIDGNLTTRWSSGTKPKAWLMIDLGAPARIDRVELDWERAWSSNYILEASNDNLIWTQVGGVQTNLKIKDVPGTVYPPASDYHDTVNLNLTQSYRYIRVNSLERGWSDGGGGQYGVSLWEFAVYGAGGQDNPAVIPLKPEPVPGSGDYNLVWSEEFSNSNTPQKLDPAHWNYEIGDGCDKGICAWGNREKQYYTDSLENVNQQNGTLNVTLLKDNQGRAYTSGRVTTAGKHEFTYGRISAKIRMKMPESSTSGAKDGAVGVWGAFWTLGADVNLKDDYLGGGWPNSGEIDIFENIGYSWWYNSALHGPGYSGGGSIGGAYNKRDTTNGIADDGHPEFKTTEWHTYQVEWTDKALVFSIDGFPYRTIPRSEVETRGQWVYNKPNFILLNLAYDGEYPLAYRNDPKNFTGPKTANGLSQQAESNFPHTMQVDWVKVEQRGGIAQPPQATLRSLEVATDQPGANLSSGATKQFTATGIYSDGSRRPLTNEVTWVIDSATDRGFASVNNQGLVTGVRAGSGYVYATFPGLSGTSALIPLSITAVVTPPPVSGAPTITTQPAAQTITAGQHALFSVSANGATSYQWKKNGSNIAGATSAIYYTDALQAADAGAVYTVTATNSSGSVTSDPALVVLNASADGAPPSSFWGNLAALPVATKATTFSFVNQTNGKYPDSQVFWEVRGRASDGTDFRELHSIAERPTFDMPILSAARMYFYLAKDAASVNTGDKSYYDFIEFNTAQDKTTGVYAAYPNTTRVDAFGLKLAINLSCADGQPRIVGEDYGTFLEDRDITFKKYLAEVPAEFAPTATLRAPYRILEPGAAGFKTGGVYANYYQSYIDQVWVNNGITLPKPTPFLNYSSNQYPDLEAAVQRHVAHVPGTFTPEGKLVDRDFWKKTSPSSFYQTGAANYYSKFWHTHGIGSKAYGFPYDDVGDQAAYVSCQRPKSVTVAIGW
jgi:beta-glucanase (GH16 family)